MTVVQTIGVYALIPLALYGVLTLFTLWPKIARGPRYRPGQEWPHEPVWWTGNPQGASRLPAATAGHGAPLRRAIASSDRPGGRGVPAATTARGGARGTW